MILYYTGLLFLLGEAGWWAIARPGFQLYSPEVGLQHVANVLGVTQVQGRVHLVFITNLNQIANL
jgi:hypothetical protein